MRFALPLASRSLVATVAFGTLSTLASAQISISASNTPFTDISATGTSPGASTDDAEFNVASASLSAAGFTGNELLALTNIRIGNNGCVIWNSTAGEVGYINSTVLPTMAPLNGTNNGNGGLTAGQQFVCPLWDDNTPATGQGSNALDWQVISGNLIIQWSNEDHFNAAGAGTVQYQMIVYSGRTIASGLPLVEFVYNDTLYAASQYQNDGGSSTIGYKNWGVLANANDVEFGLGGGNDTITDPAFGDPTMKPKVGGWAANSDPSLPKSVVIKGSGPAGPVSYCTAGTSTAGCSPTLSGQNLSASFAGACSVTATGVEGQKSGILFYGISGQQGTLWCAASTSFLCVKSPTQRTTTQTSGGTTGACDGTLTIDVNDYLQTVNPGALGTPFSSGNTIQWQAWYRDPPACKTTQLSNGLEMTVVP